MLQFAAVLNEKKAKAIEWKQIAEQAQDSVQRAGNEVCSVSTTVADSHLCKRLKTYRIQQLHMFTGFFVPQMFPNI